MADYITTAEGDTYAAVYLDAPAWQRATLARKAAAIAQATRDIETMRFQGRKYDPAQEREFPRLVEGDATYGYPDAMYNAFGGWVGTVWDWDSTNNVPKVPDNVKRACFEQALSLLQDGARKGRIQAIEDGLVGQAAGGVSEQYDPLARKQLSRLCSGARDLLKRYQLRSGRLV